MLPKSYVVRGVSLSAHKKAVNQNPTLLENFWIPVANGSCRRQAHRFTRVLSEAGPNASGVGATVLGELTRHFMGKAFIGSEFLLRAGED